MKKKEKEDIYFLLEPIGNVPEYCFGVLNRYGLNQVSKLKPEVGLYVVLMAECYVRVERPLGVATEAASV